MHTWISGILLRTVGILALVLIAAGALTVSAEHAGAQEQALVPATEQPVGAEDLRQLSAALEDEAKRAELLANIRALIEVREAAPAPDEIPTHTLITGVIGELSESVGEMQTAMAALARKLELLPTAAAYALDRALDPEARARWLTAAAAAIAVAVAAIAVEILVKFALRRPRRALESREFVALPLRLVMLLARTIMDLVPIAALAILVAAVLSIVDVEEQTRVVALTIVNAYVFVRAILVLARAILAPATPSLRLFPIASETANYLNIWVRRLTLVGVIGYFVISGGLLLGMTPVVHTLLLRLLGFVLALMAIVFILQNRAEIAGWIRSEGKGRAVDVVRRRIAAVWHVLAVIYVAAVYLIWAADIGNGFAFVARATVVSAIVLAAAVFIQNAMTPIIRRGFGIGKELQAKYPDLERRANKYLPILSVALRCILWGVALLAVLAAWGIDAFGWLVTPAGGRLLNRIVSIAIVLAGAAFVWEFASSGIENYLARRTEAGKATARARTLLPLLRNALLVVLSVMVSLIVLSEIGVDIGPLLAGAGVVGLAIGFGSQTLVKDVITGAFLLFEDAISVGDVVSVAGTSGLVEGLSIRSIRLRDVGGNVHTIPFSSVGPVTNMTKEFSFYVMDIGVAYREDTDHVTEVVKEIVEEMRVEPAFEALILEPLEVLGVDRFADSAVIIKARLKTVPVKQWMVGREFNRRMKKRFDALGIEIPFPHQTIYFGIDKTGAAPPARIRVDGPLELERGPEPSDESAPPAPVAPPLSAGRGQSAIADPDRVERT
jgi:moderate conductance mechanosensitive channel